MSPALPNPQTKAVAVIGGGPAGLMAAETLAQGGAAVTVYDRMPSFGRKLLMAGRGGLNLTHSEDFSTFVGRYREAAAWLRPALLAFPPAALVAWCEGLGQATFVGSSGRVFPGALKASPLLRAWLGRLAGLGVRFRPRWRWTGWTDGALAFDTPDGARTVVADATVLAMGGASWPRLGSDGTWADRVGVRVAPFKPANCGVLIAWSDLFRARFAGQPLKRIALRFRDCVAMGEAMITDTGLEGGAVYQLAAPLRDALEGGGAVTLHMDLRPDIGLPALAARLDGPRGGATVSALLRRAGLMPAAIGVVQEALHAGASGSLAALVKATPLRVTGTAPLDRAISTAGGIVAEEVDAHFMLRRRPGVFVAGEMLDWEAPTGGYLLQGAFSTGVAAAAGALAWLAETRR